MFTLSVEDDQGRKTELQFNPPGLTIGRAKDNQLRLNERNVSRKHARIAAQNGSVVIEDLDSYNGIRVNGDRINGKATLYLGDHIQLGDFRLQISGDELRPRPEEITQKTQVPKNVSEEVTNTEPMVVAPLNTGPQQQMQPPVQQPSAPAAALQSQPPIPQPRTRNDSFDESTALIRLSDIAQKPSGPAQQISGPVPKLVCVKGPMAGREWPVSKTEVVIGRGQENDIVVDHRSLSRQHAKLVFNGQSYRVIDCNSSNGTLVNGEKYAQVDLKRGDVIELGHVKVRLMFPGETAPALETTADDAFDESTEISRPRAAAAAVTQVGSGPVVVPKNNKGIFIAVGVGTMVAIVAIVLIVSLQGESPAKVVTPPPVHAINVDTPPPQDPPKQTEPPPQAAPDAATILKRANEEMSREQWDQAIRILETGLETQPGQQSLKSALERAETEKKAKAAIDSGTAAFQRGDYQGAKETLQQVPESSMYYQRAAKKLQDPHLQQTTHNTVIAAKSEKKDRTPDRPPPVEKEKPTKPVKEETAKVEPKAEASPAPAADAPSARDQAKKLFDQGNKALLQNKNKEAIELYLEATRTDPKYALPHRGLGIAHARAGNGDAAVEHYKIYLKLAPGAPDAEQVRKIVHDYESSGD